MLNSRLLQAETMRFTLPLRYTLWMALCLSLVLHVLAVFSEEIQFWVSKPDFQQTELKKAQRKLKAVTLDEETDKAEGKRLAGPLVVYLQAAVEPKQIGKASSAQQGKEKPLRQASRKLPAVPSKKTVAVTQHASASDGIRPEMASKPEIATASPVQKEPIAEKPQQAAAVVASASAGHGLDHYPREMKITYIYGVIPARMTWKVVDGRYDLHLDGGFLGISRTFVSTGKADRRGVVPERFIEYRNNKPDPFYQVDFDWEKLTAEVGEPGDRKTEAIVPGDQDIFSTAFQVGLLGDSKPEYTFSMFSGRRKYEKVHLKVAGEAKLRLGNKEVDALLLRGAWDDRQVDFWLAPEWNNIPVRMTIVLGKEMTLDIWANEITIEGKKVLEWVKPQGKTADERGGGSRR